MFQIDIEKSLEILNQGGVILYPTDTVWGIGCDATNSAAVERIFTIKQRDEAQAMLTLVDGLDRLAGYVENVPDIALQLMEEATRPLTVIYPKAKNLAANLIATDGSIGIRIVQEPFCRQLIKAFGKPIVSTSANISGEPAAGIFDEISEEIKKSVDFSVYVLRPCKSYVFQKTFAVCIIHIITSAIPIRNGGHTVFFIPVLFSVLG